MIWRCLDSILVMVAFTAVYLLPPLLVVRRLLPGSDRLTQVVVSTATGLASQAILGFFANHLVPRHPLGETCLYFLCWLLASLACQWGRPPASSLRLPHITLHAPWLPCILLAAIALRSFDGLSHASLGQSDAYTHLQFLRDVIQRGEIRNVVYPPGYSWVLALPTLAFNLDAYLVARYAGPFFGALLVIVLFLLGRRHSPQAGLFAAFLAAACPLFYPLVKTGMGTFANQLGLFLLPLALLLYLMRARLFFTLILLGLTASVPVFVFTLALVVLLNELLSCLVAKLLGWESRKVPSATQQLNPSTLLRAGNSATHLVLPFLLAFSLAGYHFLRPGKLHVETTASLVTGIETPSTHQAPTATQPAKAIAKVKSNPAGKLLVDLVTVKRWGLGSSLLNTAILILVLLFGGLGVAAFRRDMPDAEVLLLAGGWGLLNTVQVAAGLLEFSLYQRSGWLLMEVAALAGGIVLATLYDTRRLRKLLRPLIGLGVAASLLLAFWSPPQHRCITSSAENELATVLRELSDARLELLHAPQPFRFEHHQARPLLTRAAGAPQLAVVTRRYTFFHADQGNLAAVLPDPAARIRHVPVKADTPPVPPSNHFLCLVDRYGGLPDTGFLDRISPELTQSLASYQPALYQPNEKIVEFVSGLPKESWEVTWEQSAPGLMIAFVERTR